MSTSSHCVTINTPLPAPAAGTRLRSLSQVLAEPEPEPGREKVKTLSWIPGLRRE